MSIIAIAAQKGGVGKTTIAVNLAVALEKLGMKVLLVDTDPQANTTDTIGGTINGIATLYDLITEQESTTNVIQHLDSIDLIAADPLLAGLDVSLSGVIGREYRLRDALDTVKSEYNYIVIDTPPQLGILMINALTAADAGIIPFTADRYAVAGIAQLTDTIANVRRFLNPSFSLLGLLINKSRSRERLTQEVEAVLPSIAEAMGTQIFDSQIHNAMGVRTAQAEKHSIFEGATASSVAAADFMALAKEIIKKEAV